MSNLLKFNLVAGKDEDAEVLVNPVYIETVVDGKPFHQQDVTQITLTSGHKFFVKQPYAEVKIRLSKYNEIV